MFFRVRDSHLQLLCFVVGSHGPPVLEVSGRLGSHGPPVLEARGRILGPSFNLCL